MVRSLSASRRSPDEAKLLVKRIVALPGDKVRTSHLLLLESVLMLVRGTQQVKTLAPYPDPEVTIPDGHVWVEGVFSCVFVRGHVFMQSHIQGTNHTTQMTAIALVLYVAQILLYLLANCLPGPSRTPRLKAQLHCVAVGAYWTP